MKTSNLLVISLVLWLVACTSPVLDSVGDPNFHVGTLQQSLVVVADIDTETTAFVALPDTAINALAVNALRTARRDLQVFNHHRLYAEFSDDERLSIRHAAARQFVKSSDKALLARMAAASDMVIFTRLLSDTIESEESEHWVESDGKPKRRILTRTTWRKTAMQVDIYDVNQQALVWSAIVDNTEANEQQQEKANGSFLENLAVDILEAALVGGFPPAPSHQDMIESLFKKLGASLPQKSCRELGFSECMKRSWQQS